MGRTASGVRGMKLAENDQVVSLIVPSHEGDILTVTENGYGKRTALSEYPTKENGKSPWSEQIKIIVRRVIPKVTVNVNTKSKHPSSNSTSNNPGHY